jgi:hypothetical protein
MQEYFCNDFLDHLKYANIKSYSTEVIRAGLRSVSARKRCAEHFKTATDADDTEISQSNKSHSHFIKVMEDVLSTLLTYYKPPSDTSTHSSPDDTPRDKLESFENRFAALEVDDPTEVNAAKISSSRDSEKTAQVYELESTNADQDSQDDKFFAMYCLFDDFGRLRKFLADIWQKYNAREVDLVTASAVTNTGIQLAIRTQQEILGSFPSCSGYQSVFRVLIDSLTDNPNNADQDEFEMDDAIVDWIFAPAHSLLESFCDVLQPNQVPLMKRGHFGVYNPRTDRSKLNDTQKQHEDLVILMELLPEFAFLSRYKISLFAVDELTRGLIRMIETREIPTWLPFAVTVFLDIHHALRHNFNRCFRELQTIGRDAKKTLSRHLDFSQDLKDPHTWTKQNQNLLLHFAKELDEMVLKDYIFPNKVEWYSRLARQTPGEEERFYLYKHHPILCGITAFRITLEMQNVGVSLCSCWGTVTYPAHFYNALKKSYPETTSSWPLMDQVIKFHGESQIFVGAPPKTMVECFRQVSLMLGISAQTFARNRRMTGTVNSKNGPRGLKDSSPIGELFRYGLSGDRHNSIDITMHNVEEIMNDQALDSALASDPANKSLRREWNKFHRLTSLQFLEALRAAIPV